MNKARASKKVPIRVWEKKVQKMSKQDLLCILATPGTCTLEFMEVVKARLNEIGLKDSTTLETRELFIKTIEDIGCSVETDEDDTIYFSFRGGYFYALAPDFCRYVSLELYNVKSIPLDNIEDVNRMKIAINENNMFYNTTYYDINEEKNTLDVVCRNIIPFSPQIPYLEEYLCNELERLFVTYNNLFAKLTLMRREDAAKGK